MDTRNSNRRPRVGSVWWRLAFIAAWLAGALCLSTPFNLFWRLGNGNLGHNILITLACALAGIALLVPVTAWAGAKLAHKPRGEGCGATLAAAHLLFAACACGSLFAAWPRWLVGVTGTLLTIVIITVLAAALQHQQGRVRRRVAAWMRRRWSFNGAFWITVFVLLVSSDLYALWLMNDLNGIERTSAALGRVATQAVLTLGLMLLFHGIRGLTPSFLRPLVLTLFSLLPFLIVTDFLLRRFWNQSLLSVVNLFTSTGSFDFEKEVAAAGLNWTIGQVSLVAAAVVALCAAFFWGLGWLSRSAGFRTANKHVFRLLLVCWLIAVAEGGLSHATKRVEAWQKHHKAFDMHIGLFAPPLGLERIAVEFREPAPETQRELLLAEVDNSSPGLRKPDVYVFMIESWRSDSITPEVAPFLWRFRSQECQELGTTYAASNCTPLSWFGFFHSRIAIHWSEAVEQLEGGVADRGAYPLRVLDKLGYEIHARAVCDLGYKHLGPLNFGKDHALADFLSDDSMRTEPMGIPQRELIAMQNLREYLETDPQAPQFHFTALDSPHYNYYWPEGFQTLHHDCAANIPTNLRPSEQVVDGVVRRYENSVHWIDYAIEEFVEFLKLKGRYENSVIIVTGDHGEEFQEEGSWFHCSALNRYQTEVPIVVKWPSWAGDLPVQNNVSHLDVMPSLMQMIGLEPKFYTGLSGRSLLDYNDAADREAVIATFHRGSTGIGLCLVRGDRKVRFAFGGVWSMDAPSSLHVTGYSDRLDQLIDPRSELGGRSHTQFIRDEFPSASSRFFSTFERR